MTHPTDVEKISCDICRKEVPLSEAMIPEAEDYVAHFCGLECYTTWKKQSDKAVKPDGDSGK